MHYYIDGYNLLFYLFGTASNDLKSQRELLIQDLNKKIEFLALDISIVFDSHLCPGDGSRSHFHYLEILFTPQNVTADDFIIKKIKHSHQPTQETLVTNDKELALRARNLLASTQTLTHFLNWLDRRYSNQKKEKIKPATKNTKKFTKYLTSQTETSSQKTLLTASTPERPKLIPHPTLAPQSSSDLTSTAPLPGSIEFYLSQFETSFEIFVQQKQINKEEKKKQKSPKPPKLKPKLSFEPETPPQSKPVADFERWREIFEQQDKAKNKEKK